MRDSTSCSMLNVVFFSNFYIRLLFPRIVTRVNILSKLIGDVQCALHNAILDSFASLLFYILATSKEISGRGHNVMCGINFV